jgi:hypothetical protein
MKSIFPKKFITTVLITSIWVNISEVFRYFVIVMPQMRKDLSAIPNVAPMDWVVFSIWGVWDTILTAFIVFIAWLCFNVFGKSMKTILVAGTTCWLFFLLFWIGMVNMNLAKPSLLLFTLPLSWIEMTVAAWIASKFLSVENLLNE